MQSPEEVYTEEWYKKEYMKPEERGDYEAIAKALLEVADFDDVIDIGCGPGLVLGHLQNARKSIIGVEGSAAAWSCMSEEVKPHVWQKDLRTWQAEGAGWELFDLVICTEVAEHMDSRYADHLVSIITERATDRATIFFTGAQPGQGGLDHVNEQPRWYWLEKFAERGWWLDRTRTGAFKTSLVKNGLKGLTWVLPNAMLLRLDV